MKTKLSRVTACLFAIFVLAGFFVPGVEASGSIYLFPALKTVSQGAIFSISVRVSSTAAIDSVQANLGYDASKLTYLSTSTSGSAFNIQAENSAGGGSVKIGRGIAGSVSGDKLVAIVNFKALVYTGSTTVSFIGGSEADSAGNPVVTATAGATVNFTAAPAVQPTPPADTTAPVITNVKVTKTGLDFVIVSWVTNEPANSTIDYGTDKGYFLTQTATDLVTQHNETINSKYFEPAKIYHLQVKSKDAAGNEAKGSDTSFKTSGYTLNLKIVDIGGTVLKGAKVTLSGMNQIKTVSDGNVTFKNVPPGVYSLIVEYNNQTKIEKITVKDSGAKSVISKDVNGKEITDVKVIPQNFEVKVAGISTTKNYLLFVLVGVLVILVLVGFFTFAKWRRSGTFNGN